MISNEDNYKTRMRKFIADINLRRIYNLLEYGIPKRPGTVRELRAEGFHDLKGPVFFLSTGRCGTKWFARHLHHDRHFKVFHEPWPNFAEAAVLAYQYFRPAKGKTDPLKLRFFKEIFLAGRQNQLRFSYKTDRCYVETNHYLTFLAPVLVNIFPNVKFVHVYRHPAEFVRSGIRRRWYDEDKGIFLTPLAEDSAAGRWQEFSEIEKLGWLWNETNRFIEDFKTTIPENKIFTFNFNQLTFENVRQLDKFIGAQIRRRKIVKMLGRKENVQKEGRFKKYRQWTEEEKRQLKNQCAELAAQYGYPL